MNEEYWKYWCNPCQRFFDCGISEGYRIEIANETNPAERKIMEGEHRRTCNDMHESCIFLKNSKEEVK